MRFTAWLLFLVIVPLTFGEAELLEAVRLLERLSSEGVDVSRQVEELNRALELYRANKTVEADELVAHVLQQLVRLEEQLPAYRLQRWLRMGAMVAALLAAPPLFYYFFPRLYALIWAYARRNWIAKAVRRSDSRR